MTQGMQERIARKLAQGLHPIVLKVVNDSARHAGHAGDNGTGESHFNVFVVSMRFHGVNRIGRQRLVYDLLKEELEQGLHALSVKALAPDEYDGVQ